MFAYCGNNPVSHKDIDGQYWVHAVDKAMTEIVEEKENGTIYRTTVSYEAVKVSLFGCSIWDTDLSRRYEVEFTYSVTSDGVILYDNKQPESSHLSVSVVRRALAKEMHSSAQSQVQGSLQNRTIGGISVELLLHYMAYNIGFFPENAEESYIGGTKGTGYDRNGLIFEFFALF